MVVEGGGVWGVGTFNLSKSKRSESSNAFLLIWGVLSIYLKIFCISSGVLGGGGSKLSWKGKGVGL